MNYALFNRLPCDCYIVALQIKARLREVVPKVSIVCFAWTRKEERCGHAACFFQDEGRAVWYYDPDGGCTRLKGIKAWKPDVLARAWAKDNKVTLVARSASFESE